jgi:hypothetical protein
MAELSDFPEWTDDDEQRPNVQAPTAPAELSERGRRVLKANAKLRDVWNGTADGFPSDSERAYSLAYHAGRAGLSIEDATWLLCDLYSRPGAKKLHRTKLEKTLRAWAKGRDVAAQEETGAPVPAPGAEEQEEPTPRKAKAEVAEPYEMLALPEYLRASFAGAVRLVPALGLTECGVGLFTAPSGDGKSTWILNAGPAWAGIPLPIGEALPATRPLRVMIFQVENSPGMEQERLRKIIGTTRPTEGLILFTRKEPIRFSGAKGRPNVPALERLATTLAKYAPIDLVIFDPLVYLHEAEENSSSEMMRWLVPLREVCRQAGAAILVVHHAGWVADGDDARGRGTTAIRAWADFELALRAQTRNGHTLHRLNLVKTNFAPRWKEPLALELAPDTLRFRVVDEAGTLCPPEEVAAWLREEQGGSWDEPRARLYEAIAKRFACSDRTAREAVKRAAAGKLVIDEGQRKPLRVANSCVQRG